MHQILQINTHLKNPLFHPSLTQTVNFLGYTPLPIVFITQKQPRKKPSKTPISNRHFIFCFDEEQSRKR
ncbi:hypothetical protein L1887_34017 [Cichorium endivia]|nr:hypothetical protein L1887_34017 [Cichorium endivia]